MLPGSTLRTIMGSIGLPKLSPSSRSPSRAGRVSREISLDLSMPQEIATSTFQNFGIPAGKVARFCAAMRNAALGAP